LFIAKEHHQLAIGSRVVEAKGCVAIQR
jgi:hypothetical protein